MKAPFTCLVYVLVFEEERGKNDARTSAAIFLGIPAFRCLMVALWCGR